MFYKGKGVQQDYNKAFYWYEKAAQQGFADAQSVLGHPLRQKSPYASFGPQRAAKCTSNVYECSL